MKFIISLLLILIVPLLPGCGDMSCKDVFTLKSVRNVQDRGISRLKKKATEYDSLVQKKVESADKAAHVYQQLGEKYLERKTWDLSIESFEKAIGYGRNSPNIHYSLALAYANRGKELNRKSDFSKAEHHYRRTLEIKPEHFSAEHGLGILQFYFMDKRSEGLKTVNDLVRREQKFYRARFTLARFYYEMKNPQKALSIYENLYADIKGLPDSTDVREYKQNCKKNIERIMLEISGKKQ